LFIEHTHTIELIANIGPFDWIERLCLLSAYLGLIEIALKLIDLPINV